MLISTKGRYAMRFMIDLALRGPEEKVSLREIAEFEGISLKYLEQLVRPLTQAGLIKGMRGKNGGYCLAKPTSEIKPVMCYVPWKAPRSLLPAAL